MPKTPAEQWADFLTEFPYMGATECVVCREGVLYAKCSKEDSGRIGITHRPPPKTCGRYRCMVETGEMKAIGA